MLLLKRNKLDFRMKENELKFHDTYAEIASYKPIRLIDKGKRTTVYLAWCSLRNAHVIVKIGNKELSKQISRRWIQREADFLSKNWHPNIVNFYEVLTEPVDLLVEEYHSNTTLESFLRAKHFRVEWHDIVNIYSQLLSTINYIHSQGYVYLDLKLSNIIYGNGVFKMIDFGHIRKPGIRGGGSRLTMSPEQARNQLVDCSADIWSIGVIMFVLVTGRYPYDFSDKDKRYPQKSIKPMNVHDFIESPHYIYDAIYSMLSTKSLDRPTAQNLLDGIIKNTRNGPAVRA